VACGIIPPAQPFVGISDGADRTFIHKWNEHSDTKIFLRKYGIEDADAMPHIFFAIDKDLDLTGLPDRETPDNVPITLLAP
jgi:hypothetical protein